MTDERQKPSEIGRVGEHGYIGDLGTNHPRGVPRPHLSPEQKEAEKAEAKEAKQKDEHDDAT
jgi:hypothetical protein